MRKPIIVSAIFLLLICFEIIVVTYSPTLQFDIPAAPVSNPANQSPPIVKMISPAPGSAVTSPFIVSGQAPGTWFFEARFPIVIVNWDGVIVGGGHAEAKPPPGGTWMTTDYVPFTADLTYTLPEAVLPGSYNEKGTIIFKKDNPSALPQNDASSESPIIFR